MYSLFRCIISLMPDQEFHNCSTLNRFFKDKALLCQQRVKQYRVPVTQQVQVLTCRQLTQRCQYANQRLRLFQPAYIQYPFSTHQSSGITTPLPADSGKIPEYSH